MPTLISPPLVGGAGQLTVGRVVVAATESYEHGGDFVTTVPQAGVIRDGKFFDLVGDQPFVVKPTPDGVGMRIDLYLSEQDAERGVTKISRLVRVPDVAQVAWASLVDIEPAPGMAWIGSTPPPLSMPWLYVEDTFNPMSGGPLPVYTAPDGTTVEHGELVEWSA